jgi:hypothetical protein
VAVHNNLVITHLHLQRQQQQPKAATATAAAAAVLALAAAAVPTTAKESLPQAHLVSWLLASSWTALAPLNTVLVLVLVVVAVAHRA